MIIGVPTEIKTRENRVGINPGGVRALTKGGHQVLIQKGAGLGAGITDKDFENAGARIVPTAADACGRMAPSSTRPSRAQIAGSAATSPRPVWMFTMQARRT